MSKSRSLDRDLSPEKTELILDSAMQEFLENGYAGARMDKIAATAGVSKATVYRRYPDKESLFSAIVQRLAQRKGFFNNPEKFQSELADPRRLLRSLARQMLDNIAQDPQNITFFRILIAESGRFPALARSFAVNIEKPTLERLSEYLGAVPQLQGIDPDVAARAFMGTMVHFIILKYLLDTDDVMPMESDRLIDNLIQLILRSEP